MIYRLKQNEEALLLIMRKSVTENAGAAFPGTSIALGDLEDKVEMRTFAIVFATFFMVALFLVIPMLYRAKSADKLGSSPAAEERAPLARGKGFENGMPFSQPLWLLMLGTALIVSANQLSRVLQTRASVPRSGSTRSTQSPRSDATRARGAMHDRSVRDVSLHSAPLDEHTWLARRSEGCEVDRL